MPPPAIYLDHNATTPILPEIAEAVREASLLFPANPSSQHEPGRQARRALEKARDTIGKVLGARMSGMDADQVIFTSGGTESNNLALTGLMLRDPEMQPAALPEGRLIISVLEHPSVSRVAEHLAAGGCEVVTLGVDRNGVVRVDELAVNPPPSKGGDRGGIPDAAVQENADLSPRPENPSPNLSPRGRGILASIILASNETGVVQPVAQIAALCRRQSALIHTDATQAVGKIPVSFRELGVDALTATAHKFHGPRGVGVLLVRHGVILSPTLYGGFQQASLRPGTESVALAIGMAKALELYHGEAASRREHMATLRDRLEHALTAGDPDAVVVGAAADRLPNTSNIALVGLDRQALVMALDLAGVACSTGSACASGSSEPSPALVAMGLPEGVISASVRFSLASTTTVAEVDEAARRILMVCNRLRHGK